MKTFLAVTLQFLTALVACADPGTATLNSLTMNPGGRYDFELNNALATPGNGADFLNVINVLDIAAGTTPNTVFTIALVSLNNTNASAPLSNFDSTRGYLYLIATAGGGITRFNPAKFAIDLSRFLNTPQVGHFSMLTSEDGKSLILQFRPASVLPFVVTQVARDSSSTPGSVRTTLTWNAIIGLTYRIQKCSDLVTANWIDDSPTFEATSTSAMATSFYTSPAPNKLFWRVIEVP